ncbi:hypothetical protein QNA09_27825 (plasmid) [Rhodococcus sp. AH-ZY2]|nr:MULTISPECIES: hypothetical protein [Rhodococcus]WML66425.1 hypothetical protein QNA09_27825 [Rhodococcus sp. AH-ZY2]
MLVMVLLTVDPDALYAKVTSAAVEAEASEGAAIAKGRAAAPTRAARVIERIESPSRSASNVVD